MPDSLLASVVPDLAIKFFLQLAIILVTCRVVGWLGSRLLGQPQVVGEMIAGVVLGPSLLGYFWPETYAWLFPQDSRGVIACVCQVGLAIYMFLVGAEFDIKLIQKRMKSAFLVSSAGILAPFVFSGLAVWLTWGKVPFYSETATLPQGMLFMGAALSVTAFPMLARIIYERGLTGTSLGTLALAAGSLDDAAAWCILAIVLATFQSDPSIAMMAIAGGVGYAAFCAFLVRPALKPLARRAEKRGGLSRAMLGMILALLMFGAWVTDVLGIYAVFGAFILGLCMPRGIVSHDLQKKLEPMTTTLLLPLFFIYSGLNTKIALLNDPKLIGVTLFILAISIGAKFIACWLAALASGENNREALAIGSLMNARGLMELILLNIGLNAGVITETLYTILVLMAIVTTLMATPLFNLVYGRHQNALKSVAS